MLLDIHQTDVISDYFASLDAAFQSGHHICHSSNTCCLNKQELISAAISGLRYVKYLT